MEDNLKLVVIVYIIENVSILILCGFLCWNFKSPWGLIPLIFMNTGLKRVKAEEGENNGKQNN